MPLELLNASLTKWRLRCQREGVLGEGSVYKGLPNKSWECDDSPQSLRPKTHDRILCQPVPGDFEIFWWQQLPAQTVQQDSFDLRDEWWSCNAALHPPLKEPLGWGNVHFEIPINPWKQYTPGAGRGKTGAWWKHPATEVVSRMRVAGGVQSLHFGERYINVITKAVYSLSCLHSIPAWSVSSKPVFFSRFKFKSMARNLGVCLKMFRYIFNSVVDPRSF